MIAQPLRVLRYCRSRPLKLRKSSESNGTSNGGREINWKCSDLVRIDSYMKDLKVIDNQRTLSNLSHSLEHRKL